MKFTPKNNRIDRNVVRNLLKKHLEKLQLKASLKNYPPQKYFVDAMAFPNKVDEFPILFENVKRPLGKTITQPRRTRRWRA